MRVVFLLFLLVALVSTACKPDLGAGPSLIDRHRVIAIRSEPAEAKPGETIELQVLAVGPEGALDSSSAVWALCLAPRAPSDPTVVSGDCLGVGPFQDLGSGPLVSALLPYDSCSLFGPDIPPQKPGEPPGRPADPDVTGGYYMPVRVFETEQQSFGLIRLTCNLASAGPEATSEYGSRYTINQNPVLGNLTASIDGEPSMEMIPGAPASIAAGSRVHLEFSWPAENAETFVVYDLSSKQIVDERESLRVSWYVTAGELSLDRSGRAADDLGNTASNDYQAPKSPGSVHLWLVLRDSRGGVAFAEYLLQIAD